MSAVPHNSMDGSSDFAVSALSISGSGIKTAAGEKKIVKLPPLPPLYRLKAGQFEQQRVADKILLLNIYSPQHIEAVTANNSSIPIRSDRIVLPGFSNLGVFQEYIEQVDWEASQSSPGEYTITARERSPGSSSEMVEGPSFKISKSLLKSYQKASGNMSLVMIDAALCYAVCRRHDPLEVKELLKAGANPHVRDRTFGPLLFYALSHGFLYEAKHSDQYYQNLQEIAKLLIRAHVHLDLIDERYGSLLARVFIEGNAEIALLMINYGADVQVKDPLTGNTLLSRAIDRGWNTVAFGLIQNGVDPNSLDNLYGTVLHYACSLTDKKIAHQLIDAGANVNALNSENCTVLDVMLERQNLDIETLRLLKKEGFKMDTKHRQGESSLVRFCQLNQWNQRNCEQLKILIRFGAPIDQISSSIFKRLPGDIQLMLAPKAGHLLRLWMDVPPKTESSGSTESTKE